MCPKIRNTSTCDEDTSCSSFFASDELSPWLTQGSEVVNDETENNQIIESPSHPSSTLILHEGNYSNRISHEISLINLSLNLWPEESSDLSNLVVEAEKYG